MALLVQGQLAQEHLPCSLLPAFLEQEGHLLKQAVAALVLLAKQWVLVAPLVLLGQRLLAQE